MRRRCAERLAALTCGVIVTLAAASNLAAQPTPVGATDAAQSVATAAAAKYFPKDDADAAAKRIFRLTRDQLDATVQSLFPTLQVPSIKAVMPKDPLQTNFEFAELLAFTQSNIGPLTGWIDDIARRAGKNPNAVLDCAATDEACLGTQTQAFVVKAFRGDVSDEKLNRLTAYVTTRAKAAGLPTATTELVELVLNSPDFLFRKELDANRRGRLAPVQLLQALTYTLSDSPPEKVGLQSGDAIRHLQTEDDLAATVDGLLATAEARAKLVRFFKAWLELKEADEFTISRETFPEFTDTAAQAMVAETEAFLRQQLSKPRPSLKDITQATLTGADPKQRLGIFTQPALIASHSGPTNTRLVKRGVFWVRKVMCMEMAPPPKGVDTAQYDAATTTERERIEQITARKACIGCHKLIDPFGFFQENYDALGRWRTTDNSFPVDAKIAIDFLDEGAASAGTPVEALKLFTNSVMFKQCFVRQLFRFYMGRREDAADDPLLRRMFLDFQQDDRQDIFKALEVLATSDRTARRW